MSDFVEVKTQDLEGAALDWAVAKATNAPELKISARGTVICTYEIPEGSCWTSFYEPSTDWSQGGPLIEKYGVSLDCIAPLNSWEAFVWGGPSACNGFIAEAETPLIAACRAIVASVLGDTVSVPRELLP
ncbi:phage protein NinX family protein [Pseudomonas typographi]|uniref:phage protein NinX family protein n=1 Tax=Pseudomonas typographi TaxID=2715964 RepID=UPI001689AA2F|nr:phage protein NinX family protein [Pseudomonas typographi]MBD1590232.1 DUF2591 domain-containing protein [Pseudomonas typographi]